MVCVYDQRIRFPIVKGMLRRVCEQYWRDGNRCRHLGKPQGHLEEPHLMLLRQVMNTLMVQAESAKLAVGTGVAAINVGGGFYVTQRMLQMFKSHNRT